MNNNSKVNHEEYYTFYEKNQHQKNLNLQIRKKNATSEDVYYQSP